jgi:hypothetical protein
MAEILDLELLKQFEPEIVRPGYYRFTIKDQFDSKHELENYTILLFNFKERPGWDWTAETVALDKEGKEQYHATITPLRQELWINRVPAYLIEFIKALPYAYNKAREAIEGVSLDHHTTRESLDLETWPLAVEFELIPDYAVEQTYTLLFGEPGAGKSILAHNLLWQAANGVKHVLVEKRRDPMRVFFLSLEMGENKFRQRHNKLAESFSEMAYDNFFWLCPPSFDFTNPRERSMLCNMLKELGIRVLCVDGHGFWCGNKDTDKNDEMAAHIMIPMLQIAKELNLSFILIHHSGWSEITRIRGASCMWVGTEIGVMLERDMTTTDYSTVTFKKWRPIDRRMPRPITYQYNPETFRMTKASETEVLGKLNLPARNKTDVAKQIAAIAGITVRQGYSKVKLLLAQGLLYIDDKGNIDVNL